MDVVEAAALYQAAVVAQNATWAAYGPARSVLVSAQEALFAAEQVASALKARYDEAQALTARARAELELAALGDVVASGDLNAAASVVSA
jgi:hypothetical protein